MCQTAKIFEREIIYLFKVSDLCIVLLFFIHELNLIVHLKLVLSFVFCLIKAGLLIWRIISEFEGYFYHQKEHLKKWSLASSL